MKRFPSFGAFWGATSLGCLLLLAGCGAGPATVPTSYESFVATDKSFNGTGPAGWEKKSSDIGGTIGQVSFTSGGAEIMIVSDTAGSFMGDAAKLGSKPPVEVMQERGLAKMEEEMTGFTAMPMQTVTSPIGPARYSEFTAGDTHGYRITMMGPERLVKIICKCPEKERPALKPTFFKVFTDLKLGGI